jgi:hypothetical protein
MASRSQPCADASALALAALTDENAALTKALTGLTCGGSEFFTRKGDRYVADIDACVAWVRRCKEDAHRRTVEALTRAKAAEARCKELIAALTPSSDTKAAYIGEVKFTVSTGFDEDGCEIWQDITVPWTTTKEIMAMIVGYAATAPSPALEASTLQSKASS